MPDPVTILTNTGLARITNAIILGEALTISTIKLGSSAITPVATMTEVPDVVWTGALTSLELDPLDSSLIVARVNVPVEAGTWTVRSAGIYDTENNLIAIGSLAATEKLAGYVALTISMVIAVGSEEATFLTLVPSGPYLSAAEKGVPGGLATLGGDGKVQLTQLPAALIGAVKYQGTWDASSGDAPSEDPEQGHYWVVSVAGDTDLDGEDDWKLLDWAIFNGAVWQKVDNTEDGSGGGTVSADTVINYPGAFANWAACMAYLKGSSFTGKVTVAVANAYGFNEPVVIPDNFHMPNLHIVFDANTVNTTGWAANYAGAYTIFLLGSNCTIGSVSGSVSRTAGAQPVFAIGGNNFNIGFGTSNAIEPGSGGTMTHATFTNFNQGASFVASELRGYGKLVMTGLRLNVGEGFNGFGGRFRGLALEMDGDHVHIGRNAMISDGTPSGDFKAITFTDTRGEMREIKLEGGIIAFGDITSTGDDAVQISAFAGYANCKLPDGSTYTGQPGDSTFLYADRGRLDVEVGAGITWAPAAANAYFTSGTGEINLSGSGVVITIDGTSFAGDVNNVFDHLQGAISGISAGDYLNRTQHPYNKLTPTCRVFDRGLSDLQLEDPADAGTINVKGYTKTLRVDNNALIATLTINMAALVDDQEILLYSDGGVTAVTWTGIAGGLPAALAANTWYRFVKSNGLWHAWA